MQLRETLCDIFEITLTTTIQLLESVYNVLTQLSRETMLFDSSLYYFNTGVTYLKLFYDEYCQYEIQIDMYLVSINQLSYVEAMISLICQFYSDNIGVRIISKSSLV